MANHKWLCFAFILLINKTFRPTFQSPIIMDLNIIFQPLFFIILSAFYTFLLASSRKTTKFVKQNHKKWGILVRNTAKMDSRIILFLEMFVKPLEKGKLKIFQKIRWLLSKAFWRSKRILLKKYSWYMFRSKI